MPTARGRLAVSAWARGGDFRLSNTKTAGLVLTDRSLQDEAVQTSRNGQAGYLWYSTVA
jgi:hypothetical protein